jgi:signal transduction histidine kinase
MRAGLNEGMLLFDLGPEGLKERLHSFFRRAREARTPEIELPIARDARIETWAFRGQPDGDGGVLVLGREPPKEYRGALHQVEQSLTEVVELNRQILRQSREIERQKNELEKTVRELEESNRGVRSLHEFRMPLHTILGVSRILLEGTDGALSEEQRKQIRFMRAAAEELSTLVDDMLDISGAQAGKAILRPVDVAPPQANRS